MKRLLRILFSPVLGPLERGDSPVVYKPSHRIILIVMSILFNGLGSLVVFLMPDGDYSYVLPVIVFCGTGILGLIVGLLGNERAVAKIWGSR